MPMIAGIMVLVVAHVEAAGVVVVVAVVEGTWVVVMVDEVVAVEEEDVVAAADEMAVEAVAVAGQLSMQKRTGVSLPSQAKR